MTFRPFVLGGTLALMTATLVALSGAVGQSLPVALGPKPFVRPATPRIQPVAPSELTDAHREILGRRWQGVETGAIFRTCVRNGELCRIWLPFAAYIESPDVTITPREREMLILRTAWLSHDDVNWGAHFRVGKQRGFLTDDDLARIAKGPEAEGWSSFEAALMRAADELHTDQFIKDATWKALGERYTDPQIMDAIFAVGQYTMVAMFFNSVGMEPPR